MGELVQVFVIITDPGLMRSINARQGPDRVEAGLLGYGGYWLWLLLVALKGISFPGGFVLGQGTNTDDGRGLYHFGD